MGARPGFPNGEKARSLLTDVVGALPTREVGMNAWWWVLVGFAAWLGVSLAVGLWLGPVFRRSSQAREALDPHRGDTREAPRAASVWAARRLEATKRARRGTWPRPGYRSRREPAR
jgi:hypothetical protein